MELTLTQLEQAINYWRTLRPSSGEECALSTEVNALATVYATMIYAGAHTLSLDSLDTEVRRLLDAAQQAVRPPGA